MVLMSIEVDHPEWSIYTYKVNTRTPTNTYIYLYSYFDTAQNKPKVPVTLHWLASHLPLFYELWREHDFTCYL